MTPAPYENIRRRLSGAQRYKAANRLHLAQPSVSLALRELEDFYHVRLFDRISRRIYPTEIGNKFYDYALHIVSLFSEMESGIPSWEHNAPLHIGSSITLGNCLLPSLVQTYRSAHPIFPSVSRSKIRK